MVPLSRSVLLAGGGKPIKKASKLAVLRTHCQVKTKDVTKASFDRTDAENFEKAFRKTPEKNAQRNDFVVDSILIRLLCISGSF